MRKALESAETKAYRILLFGALGSRLFVEEDDGQFQLPAVSIPTQQRAAANLTASLQRECSVTAVCLVSFDLPQVLTKWRYQVMECCDEGLPERFGFRWIPVSCLEKRMFKDVADYAAVERSLAECADRNGEREGAPFARFGWFETLTAWLRDELRPAGYLWNGRFSQWNASPAFSLIRFETDGPAVWFKAVGAPNRHEYPITLALARYFSAFVPPLLATRPEWNGWLSIEAEGAHPDVTADGAQWSRTAVTLAELQIASYGQSLHLLEVGCRDARIGSLRELIEPFFAVMEELMFQQVKAAPAPLSRREVLALRVRLEDLCAESQNFEIPNVLGHLDFNPGNIVVSKDRCVFLDWAEAYVGHPFLTFQYLLEHLRRSKPQDKSWEPALSAAYTDPWRSFFAPAEIARAMEVVPLLAVFAYAARGNVWRGSELRTQPQVAGYFRSLTRRLKSEADRLLLNDARKGVACLA
jgi:hypothetical protein